MANHNYWSVRQQPQNVLAIFQYVSSILILKRCKEFLLLEKKKTNAFSQTAKHVGFLFGLSFQPYICSV